MYTNANSLRNKITELSHIANKYKVICVTESHLSAESVEDAEVSIPNFQIFREDRTDNSGFGGSVIYTHNSLNVSKLDWFEKSESLAVNINMTNDQFLNIICVYRSPNLKYNENNRLLNQLNNVPFASAEFENIIMVGDFNLPNVDWVNGIVLSPMDSLNQKMIMQNEFLDLFTTKGLHWYIEQEPTRCKLVGNVLQTALLDQFFSNNESIVADVNVIAPLGRSDHVCIEIETSLKTNIEYINSKRRNWSKLTEDFVSEKGHNINWSYSADTDLTVNDMWDQLNSKVRSIIDLVPEVVSKVSRNGDPLEKLPWDSSRLVRKRKEKDLIWRNFDSKPCMENFQTALGKQKQYEKVLYEEKLKHEHKIVENLKYNCKPLFKYLRSKTKSRRNVSTLKNKSGKLTESPEETAGLFAKKFQSVHSLEEFGALPEKCYKTDVNCVMNKLTISVEDVRLMLSKLDVSKSMGPDDMHPKVLKFLSANEGFVNALTILFNKCIKDEILPDIWKTATVIPLHKKGPIHLPSNYRPVSLTCILCKVFEKFIRTHILNFLQDNIAKNQHGFVLGKSTLSNLLESIDIINEYLTESNSADILYFDFAKAFDTVSHYRLLVKMQNLGISRNLINIVKDFLSNRTMKVKVGSAFSESHNVPSGVPQGSVLGPLLFLIFINDLPESIKSFVELFADDVKLLVGPLMNDIVQADLDSLSEWENIWKLKFNLEKCKVLHIGCNNTKYDYKLNSQGLKKITEKCDLRVVFNDSFNFTNQILSAVSKANQKIGWTMRNILSRSGYVITRVYKTLIRPHLEYCTQAWAPVARHGNWSLILKLESVQRKVTRLISDLKDLSYKERLESLGLTTLLERRMRVDLIETFKIINGISKYGKQFFNISERTGNLLSRQISKTKSTRQLDFFSNRVIKYWNKLPTDVKNSTSVNNFKNNLDKFRANGIVVGLRGNFWDLSDEIFKRV